MNQLIRPFNVTKQHYVIANFEEFTVYLETQKLVGDTIEVTIIRDGAEQIIPLTLGCAVAGQVAGGYLKRRSRS